MDRKPSGTNGLRGRLPLDRMHQRRLKMADRETIIETGGGGGSAAAVIGGIVIVALVLAMFFLFFNQTGGGSRTVDVDVPAVTVGVQPDGQ
jgi:hypothetical protein